MRPQDDRRLIRTLAQSARDVVLLAVYPVAAFWVYTVVLDLSDPGFALERAVAVAVGVMGVVLLPVRAAPLSRPVAVALIVIAAAFFLLRGTQAGYATAGDRAPTIDIGQTTIRAVELEQQGHDPYTTDIDVFGKQQVGDSGEGFRFFGGYKYGPVMTWAYTPGVRAAGAAGYFFTNWIALVVAAGAVFFWASKSSGPVAGAGAFALVLVPHFLNFELFVGGVNDMVPVALALVAFALRARGLAIWPAIFLGLSFGAKLLPAGIFALPLLFAGRRRATFAAVAAAVGLLAYLPPLLESPRELIAGLVIFNLERRSDATSLLEGAPADVTTAVAIVALLASAALAIGWGLRTRRASVMGTATVAAGATALFFLGSRILHRNFLLWLMPLLAVSIATRLWHSDSSDAIAPDEEARATVASHPPASLSPVGEAQG